MIKIGDKTYRNLEEQVEYLSHYHDVNQGIAQWGIRVVGQITSANELPDPATYKGEYGDAIAVGTEAPFFFYIWTRASIEGQPDHWFPFGEISIVGPEGPPGPAGPKGETGQSTKWYTSINKPAENDSLYRDGDICIVLGTANKGDVYRYNASSVAGNKWAYMLNIIGPQGIQGLQGIQGPAGIQGPVGPQGPQGDVGGFINIVGILPSADQLPSPSDLDNLTKAYLVGSSSPFDLYIQVGATSEVANWVNIGPLNVATMVTVGGNYQNVWDADTKLDKDTSATTYNQVYVKAADGGQGTINVTKQIVADAVPQRQSDGNILIPDSPAEGADAINKTFADKTYAPTSPVESINWTGRNPHATDLDGSLTGTIETGAKNTYATVLNKQTTAYNANSLAIGNKCIAKGDESLAGGYQSVTLASSSVAIGEQAVAAANSAVAFGNSTQALGAHSFAYGYNTATADDAPCALAGGNFTRANGENSVALGSQTIVSGDHSIAAGVKSSAAGTISFAFGENLLAGGDHQFVIGKFNKNVTGNAFEIGNGADIHNPKTIFAVTKDGRAKADTMAADNNDLTNKYYVDNRVKAVFSFDGDTLNIITNNF